ncbi:MAG: hypothetical protein F7C32_03575 [Desulfurococcales archaeon]|nr:hypothetical protein [Desulfurococcales archaeon]
MSGTQIFEGEIWREVFEKATEIYKRLLKNPHGWERVKLALAEAIAETILKYFKTIERIAFTNLSGGECASDMRPSLDIDLLVLVESPAEEYALKSLENVLDNALKEAFIYTTGYKVYRELSKIYRRGLHHDLLELHVNDEYAKMGAGSCPPIVIYSRDREKRKSKEDW